MYLRPPIPGAAGGEIRAWHPLQRDQEDARINQELASAIRSVEKGVDPPTIGELQMRLAELRSAVKSAQRGELTDPAWTAVRRQPILWELRLTWPDGTLVRVYFHEPDEQADRTIVALAHVKVIIIGNDGATRKLQDESIDEAGLRVQFGRAIRWGLDWSDPLYPDAQPGLDRLA